MSLAALHERLGQPRLRGVSHAYAFWVAAVTAVALVALAPAGLARTAALVYGAGLCALFGGSALYHRWRWDPRWRPLLRRIDHSTIFVFIAASYTPVALLVLHGATQVVVLAGVWVGALAGVALSVLWIDAPRWLAAATYVGLGWVALLALPQLVTACRCGRSSCSAPAASSTRSAPSSTRRSARTRGRTRSASTRSSTRSSSSPRRAHVVAMAGWVLPAG